jgi:hypothetical protein
VVITGTNFTTATAVAFGGTAATGFSVDSATQITVTVGAGSTGKVTVTAPGGTATSVADFTWVTAPTITSFLPTVGRAGTIVVITGTNFTGATAVAFGGTAATGFSVDSVTQITATVGAGATGKVTVTTAGGTATSVADFTWLPAPPLPPSTPPNPLINMVGQTSHGSSTAGTTTTTPTVGLPSIQVQSASLSLKTVTPGTPVTVTANIANRGTANGNKKVTLYVNGQVESTQGVTVNSGGSSEVTFNVSRSEPGDYIVYVDGVHAGDFKVEMVIGDDVILMFSVAMVIIALMIGMIMFWRKQH